MGVSGRGLSQREGTVDDDLEPAGGDVVDEALHHLLDAQGCDLTAQVHAGERLVPTGQDGGVEPGQVAAGRKLGTLDAGDGWLRTKFEELEIIQFENLIDTTEEYGTLDVISGQQAV